MQQAVILAEVWELQHHFVAPWASVLLMEQFQWLVLHQWLKAWIPQVRESFHWYLFHQIGIWFSTQSTGFRPQPTVVSTWLVYRRSYIYANLEFFKGNKMGWTMHFNTWKELMLVLMKLLTLSWSSFILHYMKLWSTSFSKVSHISCHRNFT